jgi:Family of unknown function (DUF6090)
VANRDLKYMLREVVLIVAGILIAFGLNAWWQGRLEAREEFAYLVRLEVDLGTMEVSLDSAAESHRRKVDLLQDIVALLSAGPSQTRADSMVALGYQITVFTPFVESVRTYDELVAAGNVELLSNDSVRAALQDYAYKLADSRDWDEYQIAYSVQVVEPAVLERLPIRIRDEDANSQKPPAFESIALFDDLFWWNLVRSRLDNELGILEARLSLRSAVVEAKRVVSQELALHG